MNGKYDDIIGLPHHVSRKRAPMSMTDRAAQFSPFAALTGYDAAIAETGRLTEGYVDLGEGSKEALNEKLKRLQAAQQSRPEVTVTYFCPDERKQGGSYRTVSGRIKKVDGTGQRLLFTDGTQIPFEMILAVEDADT